ncbi:MAG: metal-dependent transcriptional regulator [Anaerolineaceae bacterium]|jgi:DtxR family Mn-dependent transcriptional regulator|nr:metal-dependent transcriptional regulator [Anaerolineaceae bacterium]
MADLIKDQRSESEQMYLVTTATLLEDGHESQVPLSKLANELEVLSVSANQMIRKLADEDLVMYQPYHGVALTDKGTAIANRVLRHRRLWQVFLIQFLDLSFKDAEALACKMEHLTSIEVAERLSEFLDNPQVTPQGRIIPPPIDSTDTHVPVPLSTLQVNQRASVIKINGQMPLRAFLAEEGLGCGSIIYVEGIGANGAMLLTLEEKIIHLSASIAESILVKPKNTEEK